MCSSTYEKMNLKIHLWKFQECFLPTGTLEGSSIWKILKNNLETVLDGGLGGAVRVMI